MYGEKQEETEELKLDLEDIKSMYKAQVWCVNQEMARKPEFVSLCKTFSFRFKSYSVKDDIK